MLTSNKASNEEPKGGKQLPGIGESTAQGDC